MSRSGHVLRRVAPAALAIAAGACGVVLVDLSQRDLVLEPAEAVDFVVDSGAVEIYAFDRNGISLFYYMVGNVDDIGEVGHSFDGDTLDVVSECSKDGFCNIDWYAEIMLGTAVDVVAGNGGVKLTGVDAPITADVVGGGFDGAALAAPTLDVTIDEGDANIVYAAAPTSATVTIGTGNANVTLPAGAYRCELETQDGDIDTTGIECDDAATAVITIAIEAGNIALIPGESP